MMKMFGRDEMKMKSKIVALIVAVMIAAPANYPVALGPAGTAVVQAAASAGQGDRLSQEQLAALVAPIALYPDSLLAQALMASTYPLEVAEAGNWLNQNAKLKGDALTDALKQQNWDPSVKSLVTFPAVLQMMSQNLSWTQQLGNAFLAQQQDVMSAVQTLRAQAQQSGTLKSTSQQKVTSQQQNGQTVVVIEPANPQVVYVPSYNPVVVYGSVWPYPAYPPPPVYPPGYVAGVGIISFSAGVAVGAALWGGCNWGSSSVTVNNNTYNNYTKQNYNNVNVNNHNRYKNGQWQHNPDHRGNVPYANQQLQNKYKQNTSRMDQQRQQFKQQGMKEFPQAQKQYQQERQKEGRQSEEKSRPERDKGYQDREREAKERGFGGNQERERESKERGIGGGQEKWERHEGGHHRF